MSPLLLALVAGDALGILARAKRDVRIAKADQSIREATAWLAYAREHGTAEQVTAAEHLVLEWRRYRNSLERGQQ
jgi:hypothetical protein